MKPRESQCRYDNYYALPPPNGYLSSEAVPVSETGSPSPCSWRLTASPGQQINLTLYDFSVWQYGQGSGSSRGRTVCRRYAIISEGDGIRESPICGGTTRVKNIFISEGNMVDIRLMNSNDPDERAYFIIKYESKYISKLCTVLLYFAFMLLLKTFFLTEISLTIIRIMAWISKCIDVKQRDIITHPCHNFNGGVITPPLKLGHGWELHTIRCNSHPYPKFNGGSIRPPLKLGHGWVTVYIVPLFYFNDGCNYLSMH